MRANPRRGLLAIAPVGLDPATGIASAALSLPGRPAAQEPRSGRIRHFRGRLAAGFLPLGSNGSQDPVMCFPATRRPRDAGIPPDREATRRGRILMKSISLRETAPQP